MGYYDIDYLEHHGILGQKWGVRRYQNKDGSLTEAGKAKAAKGAQGRSEILREGEAKARNKRIKGAIVAPVAGIGTGVGTAAAGAAIGSTAGPVGTIAGLATGSIAGYGVGKATSAITKALFNEKANAINSEYKILASEIMKKHGDTKVKDIEVEEYKKAFRDWDSAYSKYYNNTDKSKDSSLKKREENLSEKEKAMYEKLKTKYSDKEIEDMWNEALAYKNK